MTDKITIEINDRVCEASPGEMIIAVADREGIVIPRFCYHQKLSVAANCRMCLVEAEQGGRAFPKPLPACATPVAKDLKVWTRSPKALMAQRATMEFLLINHPLDCPICDQGGECELQDLSLGYGDASSRFSKRKRVVADENLGPLIATVMTRCIHCTRCVRFCAEIAGERELGATGRGEQMRIGTYVGHVVRHELAGNVIDLCPVGALTARPSRFTARPWELTAVDQIAPHDGLGANLSVHVRRGQVMRVHPRANEAINETWIADRDRFSYQGLTSSERLCNPLIKRDGVWHQASWEDALSTVVRRLQASVGAETGWWLAPTATLEELYLAQRIARGLGCENLDHRLRQQDFSTEQADAPVPWLGLPIAQLESRRAALVIGSDLRHEQPLLAHRLRKAALAGAELVFVNPLTLRLNHPAEQLAGTPSDMLECLAELARCLGAPVSGRLADVLAASEPDDFTAALAERLRSSSADGAGVVLLGALATAHPQYGLLKALAHAIAEALGATLGYLPAAANSVGAPLAGAQVGRLPGGRIATNTGLTLAGMIDAPRATTVLWGLEPDRDLCDPAAAMRALAASDCVIACTAWRGPGLDRVADIMLPLAAFTETSGTLVNAAGTWQRFQGAVAPPGEARPGWKVLRVLGNLLDLPGFEYRDGAAVARELAALCGQDAVAGDLPGARVLDNRPRGEFPLSPQIPDADLMRVGLVPIYAADALVRRAPALQEMPMPFARFAVYLHPHQAETYGFEPGEMVTVTQGAASTRACIELNHHVPIGCAVIPSAVAGGALLGAQIAPVELSRVAASADCASHETVSAS